MFLLNELIIKLTMASNTFIELFVSDGVSVLLQDINQRWVVIKHLSVVIKQVFIFVGGNINLMSESIDLLHLALLHFVSFLNQGAQREVILQKCIHQEWIWFRPTSKWTNPAFQRLWQFS